MGCVSLWNARVPSRLSFALGSTKIRHCQKIFGYRCTIPFMELGTMVVPASYHMATAKTVKSKVEQPSISRPAIRNYRAELVQTRSIKGLVARFKAPKTDGLQIPLYEGPEGRRYHRRIDMHGMFGCKSEDR